MTGGERESAWERLPSTDGGTVAGLINAMAADGRTSVFAATGAGVFGSSDDARTWAPTSQSQSVPFSEVVAASPRFAQDSLLFVGGRGGLYRSNDAGGSWTRVLADCHVMSLVVSQTERDTLVVLVGTELDGVLRSEDRGTTWQGANAGLLDLTVMALAVSPRFGTDGTGFAATTSGLYRTRNGGKSWRAVDFGSDAAVQCVAISPGFTEDGLVLAGTEQDGLLRSDDRGSSWQAVDGFDGWGVTAVAFSSRYSHTATIAVATEHGIGVSRDAGDSWQMSAADLGAALTLAFVEAPGGEVLLAGVHDRGVAEVALDGTGWRFVNAGLEARMLLALAADETVIAAGSDDGLLVSADAGQTWTTSRGGADDASVFGVALSAELARDQTLCIATAAGVERSCDGGQTWQVVESGAARAVVAGPPLVNGSTPLLAALVGGVLVLSEDGGESWRHLGDRFGGAEIVSLAFSPAYERDRTLFIGTAGGAGGVAVWRSRDAGGSWQRWLVESGGEPLPIAVASSYSIDERVFVGLGRRIVQPLRGTREVRLGEQRPMWQGVDVGEATTLVTALALPAGAADGRVIFAGTTTGVYVSRDGAEHFSAWRDDGPGPSAVVALAVTPDLMVYALGVGGTLWRRRYA